MTDPSFQPRPQPTKAWEALLTVEYATTKHPDPEHKRRKLRTEIICFVGNTELTEVEELSISTANVKWEGRLVGELLREDYERILWELAEINFRFEFQALDQRLTTLAGSPTGRAMRIRRCFPGGCLLQIGEWKIMALRVRTCEKRPIIFYKWGGLERSESERMDLSCGVAAEMAPRGD